ncbi:hypothetical protein [Vibrio alginolyticus]|uniref:hypothetical protein n=1 Tax=Vibrio alginolyticus TaxID=663 RepID=UPI002119D574|nr:hypothetical protein [Vibrio alginolyticus]MCQ9090562.1 hypothetical protein [Vibrio alginolyticus]
MNKQLEDISNALTGLSEEAKAWALLVASNGEHDKLRNTLVRRIAKLLLRRYPEMRPKTLTEIVKICFDEKIDSGAKLEIGEKPDQKRVIGAIKVRIKGINRTSFYQNKRIYDEIVNSVMRAIRRWECQIEESVKRGLSRNFSL